MANVVFAYRYCLVEPESLSTSGQWPQTNIHDPPRPPIRWQGGPLPREWRIWRPDRPGQRLRDREVEPRETISLVWCQLNQRYWVVPADCTKMSPNGSDPEQEQVVQDKWQPLQCRHLRDSQLPGLWQLVDWGLQRQHSSTCPVGFDEFLPKNFFTGNESDKPCHFVGHLSLILALLAMCPRNPAGIPRKIDEIFYCNNRPFFLPARNHQDQPMDRYGMYNVIAGRPRVDTTLSTTCTRNRNADGSDQEFEE